MNTEVPDVSVPRNKYDIIFKAMTEQFQEQILTFYGIHLPTVNVQEHRMDCVFVLADGSYLHLEFQTQFRREDLKRFKLYDTLLYEKNERIIHMFVIYDIVINYKGEN